MSTTAGGAFLRARSPRALYAWYEQHLGLPPADDGGFLLPAERLRAPFVLAFFPHESEYFPPSQPAMLNFQVDDVDELLDRLIAAGVQVDLKRETYDYGRFGWFTDPEGNRVEVWEPAERMRQD
jgi:predicted enzyme related to lactoylglutathione lyase